MASLRDTRETLLFAYSEEWLDDIEFLVLNELNTSKNLDFPYDLYNQFDLDRILTKLSVLPNFVLRSETFCY